MTTAIMIAIIVLADSAHDVFLTRGMKEVGDVSAVSLKALLSVPGKALTNKNFLTGFFFTTVYFFAFLAVLSWADLSFVFPATSLVYVVGTLGAKFILKERVTLQRWLGILLVCLGIALTSLP